MKHKCCRYCVPPERTPTCHCTCEKWAEEVKQIEEEKLLRRKSESMEYFGFRHKKLNNANFKRKIYGGR